MWFEFMVKEHLELLLVICSNVLHSVDSVLGAVSEGGPISAFNPLLFLIYVQYAALLCLGCKGFHLLYNFSVCSIKNMKVISLVNILGALETMHYTKWGSTYIHWDPV